MTTTSDTKLLFAHLGIPTRTATLPDGETVILTSANGIRAWGNHPTHGYPAAHTLLEQFLTAAHAEGRTYTDDELSIPVFRSRHPKLLVTQRDPQNPGAYFRIEDVEGGPDGHR